MSHESPKRAPPPLIRALMRPGAYDPRPEAVELVETHISWVLLAGDYAYKIKKPVRFAFVDFSTLELRKQFCDEELRLNRRLAPEIYLDVVPIGGTRSDPAIGREPAIEYAVVMRRFSSDARADRQLAQGTLDAEDFRAFGERLARFHEGLVPAGPDMRHGSPAHVIRNALDNLADLEGTAPEGDLEALARLRAWTQDQCRRLERTFGERKNGGFVREGHGDLHLENLFYQEGRIRAFDALEFDAELRWMDVMNEAAFLAMDLAAHGRPDLQYEFLNRYLETSGDYQGLAVLRFYLVYRALVRAKVALLRERQTDGGARRIPYLEHALELAAIAAEAAPTARPSAAEAAPPARPLAAEARGAAPDLRRRKPLLVVTHGLSGSGKTSVTSTLVGPLRCVRVRSDLERKRLHGVAADADTGSGVGEGLYAEDASRLTYEALARAAAAAVSAGINVIVDASFLGKSERRIFAAIAQDCKARFVVLDCAAPVDVLRERIAARRAAHSDASEARGEVLDHQLRQAEPLSAEELARTVHVDTREPFDPAALERQIEQTAA